MAKIKGTGMSFIYDGTTIPIRSMSVDQKYSTIDVTDTSSAGDTVEEQRSRVDTTLKVDGVAIVSAAKKTGKLMTFAFNGVTYYVTDMSFNEAFNEADVTDTGVTEPYTEFDVLRAKRSGKVTAWMLDTTAEPALNTDGTCLMTFATGATITGIGAIDGKTQSGSHDGFPKYDLNITWKSASKTLPFAPTMGLSKAFSVIWKDGTNDKGTTGSAIMTSLDVTGNVKGAVTWSATGKANGAITETLYTA